MKAGEVMKTLRISRSTLHRYAADGLIGRTKIGRYFDYHEADIFNLLNSGVKRKTYIYSRVSTYKQKKDLQNQTEMLKNFAFNAGYQVNGVYSDIASGISFEKRKQFFELLDEIMEHRVERVIIAYKDRLSRVGFDLFYYFFKQFGTEITVVSEVGNHKLDSEEIFEEIVSLLHCFSMKLYSKRNKTKMEVALDES
jgi:predicted site-specific integrase-resolvase